MNLPILRRTALIAGNTFREGLRQRTFGLLLLVTLACALGALGLQDFNFGASELKFTADLGLGALAFFGSVLAITGTVQTVFAEMEQRTLALVFSRPVGRLDFVLGKLAGVQLLLGLFCLLLLGVLAVVLVAREAALAPALAGAGHGVRLVSPGGLVLAVAAQWVKFGVLAALLLLLCSIARSRQYALVAGFLLFAAGHAQAILASADPAGRGAFMRAVAGVVTRLLPDLARFDLSAAVFAGQGPAAGQVLLLAVYGLVFMSGYAVLAAFSFRVRED